MRKLILFALVATLCTISHGRTTAVLSGESRYNLLIDLIETDMTAFQERAAYFSSNGFDTMAQEVEDIVSAWIKDAPKDEASAELRLAEIRGKEKLYAAADSGYYAVAKAVISKYDECVTYKDSRKIAGKDAFLARLKEIKNRMASVSCTEVSSVMDALGEALTAYKQSWSMGRKPGQDVSFYISDPDFEKAGYYVRDPWKVKEGQFGVITMDGSRCAQSLYVEEYYNHTVYQDIDGLIPGRYRLSARMIGHYGMLCGQHLFARTSDTTVVSPALSREGYTFTGYSCTIDMTAWDTLATAEFTVLDGKLSIGAEAFREEGQKCGFAVADFRLTYCGDAVEEDIRGAYASLKNRLKEASGEMRYGGDKTEYARYAESTLSSSADADGLLDAYRTLAEKYGAAMEIIEWQDTVYAQVRTKINKFRKTAQNTGYVKQFVAKVLNLQTATSNAAATRYADMMAANEALDYFYGTYLHTLLWAQNTTLNVRAYKVLVTGAMSGQYDELSAMSGICSAEWLKTKNDRLREVVRQCLAMEVMETGATDYSGMLQNGDFSSGERCWTVDANFSAESIIEIMNRESWTDEYTNNYLHVWTNKATAVYASLSQDVNYLPNGTYTVEVKARSEETIGREGWCAFAYADSDAGGAKFCRMACPVTVTEEGVYSQSFYKYGSVWKEACDQIDSGAAGSGSDADKASSARGGKGYGWNYYRFNVEVRNHRLTVGATNDYYFMVGRLYTDGTTCSRSTGTYVELDDFRLTLKELGDNTDWSPILAVNDVEAAQPEVRRTYYVSLGGVMSAAQPLGVSVKVSVMSDGTTRCAKVLK